MKFLRITPEREATSESGVKTDMVLPLGGDSENFGDMGVDAEPDGWWTDGLEISADRSWPDAGCL
jgi:hypothetical protein